MRGLERRLAEVLAAQLVREAAAGPAAVGRAVRAERANCVAAWQWALENAASDVLAALAPPLSLHFSEAGRPSEGIRCLAGALQLPSLGVRARGRVSAALAWFHFQRGELQRGLELALAGGPLARAAGDDVAQLRSASAAAACSAMSGQLDQALGHCTEALRLAHRIGDRRRIADAHSNLGILHTRRGDDAAALGHFEQALAIYRELDQPEGIARILEFIAGLHGHRDEWQLAKRHAEEAVALHRRHGTASASRMHAQMSLGLSHLELGELDAAERELLAALRLARELEQRQNELAIECRLALLATRRGHLAEALERLRALVRTYEHSDFRSDRLNALLYYGDLLRAAGDAAAAARVWRAVAADNSAEAAVPARARRWLRALGSAAEAPQEEAFGVDEACAKVFEPHAFEAKSRGSAHP
ncbi:MAG: tetratricopeptide repeat protein [Rubrivivax sp.]